MTTPSSLTRSVLMRAFIRRNPAYDGLFVTAVRTTGIFCRPTCSARQPRPENVEFFPSPREAIDAGYRACKRCRPLESPPDSDAWIEALLTPPALGSTRMLSIGPLVRLARVATPLGTMVAAATDDHLLLLEFADRRMLRTQLRRVERGLQARFAAGETGIVATLRTQLEQYFAGTRRAFDVPLHTPGTKFQALVWDALREIPAGETRSYLELARAIGRPSAVRAVARANGDNRIAILIPCHRVIGADGQLVGYGGGVWRKRRLLELEEGRGLRVEG
jgi:O-6-methylguanine DNA methyltransferase